MSKHKVPYTEATAAGIVNQIMSDAGGIHVVVGPLCTRPPPGMADKRSYFIIATSGSQHEFRCDQVYASAESRLGIIAALTGRRPLMVSIMDDELEMARMCEVLWPEERTTSLRKAVEEERRGAEPGPNF